MWEITHTEYLICHSLGFSLSYLPMKQHLNGQVLEITTKLKIWNSLCHYVETIKEMHCFGRHSIFVTNYIFLEKNTEEQNKKCRLVSLKWFYRDNNDAKVEGFLIIHLQNPIDIDFLPCCASRSQLVYQ